jgi:hypothetical protein
MHLAGFQQKWKFQCILKVLKLSNFKQYEIMKIVL